ncbi:MAG: HD domain-containing protein [Candidatus Paceibacterota bacterium]
MNDIKSIFKELDNLSEKDKELIQKAYDFAEEAHKNQKRNSNEPYFNHLFATALNIAQLKMSATTISAGFLHDAIEDTEKTGEDLEKEFGGEIRFLVEGVTKLGKIKYQGTSRHNESLRKLFVAMSQDIRVLIIKLCDRLHNIQTLNFVPEAKRLRIATETLEIYAPIAYRLGIRKVHRELEDIAFSYVYPKEYAEVSKLVKQKQGIEIEALEKFSKSLKKELAKGGMTDFKMDHRIKGLYSLYKKLERYDMDIEKVHDLAAMRVLVPSVTDCYSVLGLIHSNWMPLPGKIKDYIAFPKPNGYKSLHTTIFTGDGSIVEIQIKTNEMYQEAEYGIASHISYKQGLNKKITNPNLLWLRKILPAQKKWAGEKDAKVDDKVSSDIPHWVKDLVKYQGEAGEEDFIDDIKTDFFEERIFVFTPIGDVIDLPKKSSVVDFAYSIHSDIGNHISGAKVNGKFVAINTILNNGDRVQIETKKTSKPSRKWLEYCKTTMAKRHIRMFLEENIK